MEKLNLIDRSEFWIEARLLRNKIAHAYLPEQLKDIYDEIKNKSQKIFTCNKKIEEYMRKENA